MKGYPKFFTQAVYGLILLVILTGLVLVPSMLDFRLEWDMPWLLESATRIWMAALHLISGFGIFMLVGAIWTVHMRGGWRRRANHRSGVIMALFFLLLGLTSGGIYYFGGADYSLASSVIHSLLGIGLPFFFLYHISLGKKRAEQKLARSRSQANLQNIVTPAE